MTDTDLSQGGSVAPEPFDPGDRWVPVDRRWLGLDRRTIAPALVVLALALLMGSVLPLINEAVPYDDKVVAGDVVEVRGGVTFVPAAGWGITDGVRAGHRPVSGEYPDSATVVDGDVSFTIRAAPFEGDAAALLEQIRTTTSELKGSAGYHFTGEPTDITTASGARGVASRFQGNRSDGTIAAFVFDGLGVEVVAYGPPDVTDNPAAEVAAMVSSIEHANGGNS
ncbi:hypothetical protein [Rhodococcus sp. ACT016]|uniref:hypothetical protein n=1 Tax=Rhodococcus sp. ACT016 TaxID=3134808 RepID=UPI003D27976F